MDRIKINGVYLVLPSDFFIPFYDESPLFIEEYTPGKWTYGTMVPNDEQGINAKALGFPNRINVVADLPREYDCECYIAGFWKIRTRLMILNSMEHGFEISIFTNVGMLAPNLKDTSIRELFNEVQEILPAPQIRITFEGTGIADDFFDFTINLNTYTGFSWNIDLNTTLNDIADIVNADTLTNGVTMEVTGDQFDIIQNAPGPKCIIDYGAVIATESGTFSILPISETQWLLDYNDDLNDALVLLFESFYGDSNFCFPTIYNPGFYNYTEDGAPEANPEYRGFLNYTDTDGDYLLNFKTGEDHDGNYYGLSPQIFTALIWDRIFETLQIKTVGDFLLHPDWNKLHFYNNRSLDCIFTTQLELEAIGTKYLTFYNSFTVADFLPDITTSEFINAIKSKFCLAFIHDASRDELIVVQRNGVAAKNTFVDFTKVPVFGFPTIKYERTMFGITFHQENDDADQMVIKPEYAAQHSDYIVGDGSTEYPNIIATTTKGIVERPGVASHLYCPLVDQPGSSLEFELGINDFSARILIYRGLNEDTTGHDYPYSTNDDTNSAGDIAGALSLLPEDLYLNHWKAWAEVIINGIPVRITLYIEPTLLKSIQFDDKYRLLENTFIVEKTQIERIIDGQYLVTFDLMKRAAGKGL